MVLRDQKREKKNGKKEKQNIFSSFYWKPKEKNLFVHLQVGDSKKRNLSIFIAFLFCGC